MDNLTHSLVGAALANAGLSRRFGRGTTLLLVLSSNLPDLDAFWSLARGGFAFLDRRMFTHSVAGGPLLALAAALAFKAFYREKSLASLFGLALLGVAGHVFFDLVNSYGVVLFHPFSRARFELGWVFIIDLAIWGMLLAPLLLGRWAGYERLSKAALAALAVYVGFCGTARAASARWLARECAREGLKPSATALFPEALGPHRFRGVVRENESYRVYLVRPLSGQGELLGFVPTEEATPAAQAARRTPEAERLEWFFKAPVWSALPDGGAEVYDLRFKSAVLKWRRPPFVFRFPPKPA